MVIILYIGIKRAPIEQWKWKGPLQRQRNMFGARIKIIWEEQLVDPHYKTSANAFYFF